MVCGGFTAVAFTTAFIDVLALAYKGRIMPKHEFEVLLQQDE